jgi:Ran-binding protein 9/10
MPIDFPNSPTINQSFVNGNKKWQWSGEQWSSANIAAKSWKDVSSNYTALNDDRIAANTSGGAFTITLPGSPSFGTNIAVVDKFKTWDQSGKNLTIARNGQTIEGLAENLVCDVVGDMVISLIYNGSTWRVYV